MTQLMSFLSLTVFCGAGAGSVGVCVLDRIHSGDSSDRRSGMSSILLRCVAGDEVYATSDATLDSDEEIGAWTFSGFKLQ